MQILRVRDESAAALGATKPAPMRRESCRQCTTREPRSVVSQGQWRRGETVEYARFERLVIGGTSLLVLLTVAASIASGAADVAEVIGQLAIIGVMGAAVHWGRKAGTIAALAACLLYLVLRLPMLSAGMTP